jgi:hypothetical protein
MQQAGNRKTRSRSLQYPAGIEIGANAALRECTLRDVSQEGALLVVEDAHTLPDQFDLVLGYEGAARRSCRVLSRSGAEIKVEFVAAPANAAWRAQDQADARNGRDKPPETADSTDSDQVDIDTLPVS